MSEPDTCSYVRRVNPSIVIVAPGHADTLTGEFGRYARDYDVRTTTSVGEAEEVARSIVGTGGQVAMFVSESRLPDGDVVEAFARWRTVVPTARRLVTVHWSHFLEDSSALRPGLAAGKYDASLLLPRGVRDEEFHTAVCELLSDWGSTVATPEVEAVRIISAGRDALAEGIRDFLDRMGMPNRTYSPDSDEGRAVTSRIGSEVSLPLVESINHDVFAPTSVRDVAVRVFGTPKGIELDAVVDLAIVGAGPAGLAAAVYGSAPATRPSGSAPSSSPAGPSPRWNPVATVSRTSCAPTVVTSARGRWSSPPVWPTESWACRRSRTSSASGSSTAARCRRPGRWRAPTSSSWVGGTPPGRRPSTSPGSRGR